MPVTFSTTRYQNSHAKMPKGGGSWLFSIDKNPQLFIANTRTFAEAKKAAIAEAKKRGASLVEVCP